MTVDTPEADQPATLRTSSTTPYFTYGLIVFLAAVFGAEVLLNVGQLGALLTPSLSTLYLLGGADRQSVVEGSEYWRLLTAPLLHADLSHLGFNCLAFFLVARRVEPVAGWRWTAATFVISAICGVIASITLNPPHILTIGASGGIVGVFVLAIFAGLRMPSGRARSRLISQAAYGAVSAVLPFLHSTYSTAGTQVDYAAHIGGMLAGGVVVAVLAVALWKSGEVHPRGRRTALAIGVTYALASLLATIPIAQLGVRNSLLDPTLPSSGADVIAQSGELIKQYPEDPRIVMARGIVAEQQRDAVEAEKDFRNAIADASTFGALLPPSLTPVLTGELAMAMLAEGKRPEAMAEADPVCRMTDVDPRFAKAMREDGLCPDRPAPLPASTAAAAGTAGSKLSSVASAYMDPRAGVVVQMPTTPLDASAVLGDALAKIKSGELNAAHKELLAAWTDLKSAPSSADPTAFDNVQALLAATDYAGGYNGLANDLAKPICRLETGVYAALLEQDGLCL